MKRMILGVLALALAGVVVVRVIQASAPVEPSPDVEEIRQRSGIPVEVTPARVGPLEVRRSFTGTVRGIRGATVRARTGDEILEIPVRVGQRVSAGEILVRQSSQGSMAAVRQAEAAFEQAKRTLERLRTLYEKGAVSEQEWDSALTGLRVAEANLEAARRSVVLTSPLAGVVTDILVTPGTFPAIGDPLVRIADLSRVQVLLEASPEQVSELSVGQPAFLAGAARGQVTRIALQADPESRLVEVEVTFPGGGWVQDAGLFPGTLASVEILVGAKESALQVPISAFHDGEVWVVSPDTTAARRTVRVGLRTRELMEVLEGLAEGEQVITAGASLLSEGAKVRIVGG